MADLFQTDEQQPAAPPPGENAPLADRLRPQALDEVVRSGKARSIGYSNWPAWLAVFGFMSYAKWLSERPGWQPIGRDLEYLRITFGWGLLLVVVFCVLGDRYLAAKRDGRLESGIDPTWLTALPAAVPDSRASVNGSATTEAKRISVE